ncbi:Uncharacterized protein TCM_008416 [Theobroma cacao]|uniref:Uncharacterized protein n=1 Tax=Theobroma cacao TaxID=3641 RepID=A0A061EBP8_THECC|nr:Uncharacterized protein TCM_008416 [Theobroma cacao]
MEIMVFMVQGIRNEMAFNGKLWYARKVMDIIKLRERKKLSTKIGWEKLSNGWLKFNINGMARGCLSSLRIGGVLRDNNAEKPNAKNKGFGEDIQ